MTCGFASGAEPDPAQEQEARYDINEAAYLIEVGKYMEALENYQSALELSIIPKTRIDALLSKATLLSAFLDAPEKALEVYRKVSREYPQAAESVDTGRGLLLFEMDRLNEAKPVLEDYLKVYPDGKFRFQAEALLEQIKKTPLLNRLPRPSLKPYLNRHLNRRLNRRPNPNLCLCPSLCRNRRLNRRPRSNFHRLLPRSCRPQNLRWYLP